MELTKEQTQVLELIEKMSAIELNGLVKAIEEKFGVSAAAMVVAGGAPPAGGDDGAASGADTVSVELTEAGGQKIAVIKVVKELLNIDLMSSYADYLAVLMKHLASVETAES